MIRFLLIAFVSLFPASVSAEGHEQYLGSYVYTEDKDERFELIQANGKPSIIYSGVSREGEHGLFYFLVKAEQVTFSPPNRLSFLVGQRDLAPRRIKSFQDLEKMRKNGKVGIARTPMFFDGLLDKGALTLSCKQQESYGTDCPSGKMRFVKNKMTYAPRRSNFRSSGRAGSGVPLFLFVAARRSPRR